MQKRNLAPLSWLIFPAVFLIFGLAGITRSKPTATFDPNFVEHGKGTNLETQPSRPAVSQPRASTETVKPALRLSRLSIRNVDSHLCDRPEEAYYAVLGLYFHAESGLGQVGHPPKFLFDSSHEDETINWANGFKGTIPVCLLVDTQGNPTDIKFAQPPPPEVKERITQRISGWHYEPGYIEHGSVERAHDKVPCELSYEFRFE